MAFVVGEVTAPITADSSQFDRALQDTHRGGQNWATQMGRNFTSVGKQMTNFGKQWSMKVSAPLMAVGGLAFRAHMNFEESMSKIIGLVGVAGDQVESWSQSLLELGPALGKTPQELADGLFFVTSAGFRGAEALEVLEMSAKGSAAGLGETKVVADLVTSAINAYGIENLDAAQATDILTAAVREGKAEAPELAASMGQVLPIASELGVTFDEIGAATAAMTRTGTDAGTAAVQLRQILASLLKPSQEAEGTLNAMGTSSAELRKQIREEGLLSVLQDLRTMTNDYGEDAMAKVFPNIRALAGVLDLMGENAEENAAIFESLADSTGALDHAFDAAEQTARQKWNKALAQLSATSITFGESVADAVIPMLESFTGWLSNATDWFNNLDEGTKRFIIAMGGIAIAIGPATMALGMFSQGLGAILTVGGKAKLLLGGLSKTALPAAAGAAKGAGTAAAGMGAKFGALAAGGGPLLAVGAALGIVALYVKEYTKAMSWDFRNFEQVAEDSFNNIVSTTVQAHNDMAISQAEHQLESIQSQIAYYQEKETLTTEEEEKLAALVEEAEEEKRFIEQVSSLQRIRAAEEFAGDMLDIQSKSNDEIVGLAEDRHEALLKELEEETASLIAEIDERHARAGTANSEAHNAEIEATKDHHAERLEELHRAFGEELEGAEDALAARGLIYNEQLGKIIDIEEENARESQAKWTERKQQMSEDGADLGRAAWQSYRDGLDAGEPDVDSAAEDLSNAVRGRLRGVESDARQAGVDAGAGFAAGLDSQYATVMATARAMAGDAAQEIKQALKVSSPSRVMMEIGENVGKGFAIGMDNVVDQVQMSMSRLIPRTGQEAHGGAVFASVGGSTRNYSSNISIYSPRPIDSAAEMKRKAEQALKKYGMEMSVT